MTTCSIIAASRSLLLPLPEVATGVVAIGDRYKSGAFSYKPVSQALCIHIFSRKYSVLNTAIHPGNRRLIQLKRLWNSSGLASYRADVTKSDYTFTRVVQARAPRSSS